MIDLENEITKLAERIYSYIDREVRERARDALLHGFGKRQATAAPKARKIAKVKAPKRGGRHCRLCIASGRTGKGHDARNCPNKTQPLRAPKRAVIQIAKAA